MTISTPKPLFDTLEFFTEPPGCVKQYLLDTNITGIQHEYDAVIEFLNSYAGSPDTFNSYRREVERFLQWSWLVAHKLIKNLDRNDVRNYLNFILSPPKNWIATKNVSRFQTKNAERIVNPEWRPFVARISKAQYKLGQRADIKNHRLNNQSMQATMSTISTFYTFLQQEEYLEVNPIKLIRQKNRFVQKQQKQRVTRKLSKTQWEFVIATAEQMANDSPINERIYFMMAAFYLLGLRISELSETPDRIPCMGDFTPDKDSLWWFTTVGKGNKVRDIAVPDAMLEVLKRYRESLNLSPLPTRGEQTPLLNKQRGCGGLGTRQVRNLVQQCFDHAIVRLQQAGKDDDAQDLMAATVHWLRHTSITADVEHRPREHVRDDAGHENAATTDRYIDSDRKARHQSAKSKPLRSIT
jgi:site-specific recombinase XerD